MVEMEKRHTRERSGAGTVTSLQGTNILVIIWVIKDQKRVPGDYLHVNFVILVSD